jgi:hypothetical protein
MKKYYCITDSENGSHIGTVIASNTKELNQKIIKATQDYFDNPVKLCEIVEITDVDNKYGAEYLFYIDLSGTYSTPITITKSWIY